MQDLRKAQMDFQKAINEQASENAALKKQMAAKELIWEQEKQKILKALKSEREIRKTAKADKDVTVKEKDAIIHSLHQSLLEKHAESVEFNRVVESLKEENEMFRRNWVKKANNVKFGLDKKNVMDLDATLKTQQENFEKKLRQTALDLENYATQKDSELIRSEVEWKVKLTALEDQMRSELAAKEESFQREQELQRRSRELEEEIKLLTQQNADLQVHNISLQELAQQTDKEKAQFKEEEKKARKEEEKMLMKDRKEEEEKEKKEKNKNEKREKEELKRQKKEKELMENKEQKRK